jgi:methionyl-tRNA formyltransferase
MTARVLFLGSKRVGLQCLARMHALAPNTLTGAISIDDRDDPRSVFDEFQKVSRERGIPLYIASTSEDAETHIRRMQPDICFVIGWYWLFREEVLSRIPRGMIGVHFSALPKYRGSSPLVWALLNGEREVGVSFFSLTSRMDAGDIWLQELLSVAEDEYVADVLGRLEKATVAALDAHYRAILAGDIAPRPQDEAAATYCARRVASDGEIDWSASSVDLFNFVRAQSRPYPGAFTYVHGEPLIVWKARRVDQTFYGKPGQVARRTNKGISVICGDQKLLRIEEVQWRGECLSAHEIVVPSPSRLGPRTCIDGA